MSGKREFPPVGLGHAEGKQGREWASPNPERGEDAKATQLSFDHVVAGTIEAAQIQGSALDVPGPNVAGLHIDRDGVIAAGGTDTGAAGAAGNWALLVPTTGLLVNIHRLLQVWENPTDSFPLFKLGDDGTVIELGFGGGGGVATDTNLYRAGANILQTDDQFRAADGVASRYVAAAGKVNGADGDFTVTPPNGTMYVVHNTTTGNSYLTARANGAWKAVQIL